MADLPLYNDFETKRPFFSNGNKESFLIDTKSQLDKWFKDVEDEEKSETEIDATAWIYRGLTEAKYKLFTSAQRVWIGNEMQQWANKPGVIQNVASRGVFQQVSDEVASAIFVSHS